MKLDTPSRWQAEPQHLFNVLHIVDNPRTAFWFFKSLNSQADAQFVVTSINDVKQASRHIEDQSYDAIFLHVSASNLHLADISSIKNWAEQAATIAIVHEPEPLKVDALMEAGVDDYIRANDINTPLLPRLVSYAVERKQTHQRLAAISQLDSITGLANRETFMHRLQQQICKPLSDKAITSVLLLDLDQFKNINDHHGHSIGDRLLRTVAKRLKGSMRQSDMIARVGGDEFFILLRDMPSHESIKRVAKNLLDTLAKALNIDDKTLFTTASIGIAIHSEDSLDAEALLKHAEIAMYTAKQQGGNRYAFFTRDQEVAASLRSSLESELYTAMKQEDFFLTYQPQIDSSTNTLYGAEVLIRWDHAEHGELAAGGFIPVLESTGLIAPVTEWVIYSAIAQWRQLIEQQTIERTCHLSINLSPRFLSHPNFKKVLHQLSHLSPQFKQHIYFEITENLFVDPENNIENLRYIKKCGFKLAMDDFGTGYSSLSYLKHFPLDCIKLDREFIRDITTSKIDAAITQAVVNLSVDLGIDLVAEGVEDSATLEQLKAMGCRVIQGYYYSKPLKFNDFQTYCSEDF